MDAPTTGNHFDLPREIVHSTIHGIGILFGIAAIPLLTAFAVRSNQLPVIIGACVYGFCFLMVFTFSTMYHGFQHPRAKSVFEILDHISIYFLIAGTYTPFILAYMNNTAGMIMLCVLWGLTIGGCFFKACFGCRYNIVSTIIYLLMGWALVWTGGDLFRSMPATLIALIITGGALYTIGVVIYLSERWKWNHAVWHSLVLAAALCHYAAVLMTVRG
jgi:hemolysin III